MDEVETEAPEVEPTEGIKAIESQIKYYLQAKDDWIKEVGIRKGQLEKAETKVAELSAAIHGLRVDRSDLLEAQKDG